MQMQQNVTQKKKVIFDTLTHIQFKCGIKYKEQ